MLASWGIAAAEIFPLDAIGRLFVGSSGLCSGFVVRSEERQLAWLGGVATAYETWVATAGHCVQAEQGFDFRPIRGAVVFSGGRVIGMSGGGQWDVAVLQFMTPERAPVLLPAFGHSLQVGDPLLLVGFGRGALMARVSPFEGYDERRERLRIGGYVSPGNSGGPVLIPGTRQVVGIAVQTTLDVPPSISNPGLYCAFVACAVKPPYYASRIDNLRGVVVWDR